MKRFDRDSIKEKSITWVLWLILALAVLMVLRVLLWASANTDVLEIKNSPVPVRTIRPKPSADGVVFLDVDYCKKIKAEGKLRISFINDTRSREVFLPESKDQTEKMCTKQEIPIAIPHDIAPDKYVVHFRVEYRINPIKDTVEEFESQPFDVVPADVR